MPQFFKFSKLRTKRRSSSKSDFVFISRPTTPPQMNYDGLLSKLTEDKLMLFDAGEGAIVEGGRCRQDVPSLPLVEDGAIEEEQAAPIQTIPRTVFAVPRAPSPSPVSTSSANLNLKAESAATATPQRKISTSSRFMNAFSQLYSGGNNSSCGHVEQQQHHHHQSEDPDLAANRTPTKGMESKLVAMWHNVKYGWSGKIRQTSFSKEQPVWLLGRCYHRRFTPPVSMESSTTELPSGADSTPDHATSAFDSIPASSTTASSSLYPALNPQHIDEIVVPQELGMDAVENQVGEQPWEEGIEGFRRDFYSRVWMTYRREFPIMNGSNYTSDCGWGCMLRSGQMLLAQGLICHFLGRSWRYDSDSQLHSTYEDNMHKKIIKWFGDSSSKSSPFSIHALVRLGETLGKKPGDWYGPASVSYLLKHALEHAAQENADFDNISVYVAKDCTIYMQDIEDQCSIPEPAPKPHVPWQQAKRPQAEAPPKQEPQQQHWKSLIVLIPLRLGSDKLNPVYAHCLKLLLSTEHCLGIIGGKPKHSLYFVGFQEDRLIHLDPHYCQEMVDINQEHFSLHSFHCKSARKLKVSKMDPSCCIGFYCATKTDFDSFMESVQLYLHPMRCASGATVDKMTGSQHQQQQASQQTEQPMEMNYPLFSFSRGRCMDHERDEMSDSLYKPLIKQVAALTQELNAGAQLLPPHHGHFDQDQDDSESEEFVLL
ncbi:cysteine protease ATG4D isoform X1 [Drosophila pseudoobscura]|uniref:Cysteine protease n=2 Tax=Drosophila pseudoobscura pseudoobscura TaxID=46245 RepID=A0A6I8UMT7_DROPS|nr:cysteine protease ATG4D isoform X1 [Drosophila pseudoobscura]